MPVSGDHPGFVDLSRWSVITFLMMTNVMLLVLHLVSTWLSFYGEERLGREFGGADLLNMDLEVSIPTWYAQTIVFVGAVLTLLIGLLVKQAQGRDHRYWMGLGVVMIFISIDEGSEIHERMIEPMQNAFDIDSGPLFYAWVIVGMVALVFFALVFFGFWRRLPEKPRFWMAVGGAVFVTGGLGVEMIGGAYASEYGQDYPYFVIVGVEEFLEKSGMSIYIFSLLYMLQGSTEASTVHVRVRD